MSISAFEFLGGGILTRTLPHGVGKNNQAIRKQGGSNSNEIMYVIRMANNARLVTESHESYRVRMCGIIFTCYVQCMY